MLYNPKECREKKKFVFFSSLRTPDPSLLGNSWTSYQSAQEMTLSFPPFSFRRIMLPREKGHRSGSITASELRRGIVPKLVRQHILLMLSFKQAFSLFSFTLIKRLFISSSLSAIKAVSSAYLRLLMSFLAILILACASSSPTFHIMYSA